MARSLPAFDPDVQILIDHCRAIPPLPSRVRTRAMARARTAAAASVTAPPQAAAPDRRRAVIALAAAWIIGFTAGAAAALRGRTADATPEIVLPAPPARVHVGNASARAPEPTPVARATERPGRHLTSLRESYAAELVLLKRAMAAQRPGDFLDGLALVSEHTRRFPHAHLGEEREALRVRLLADAGHPAQARGAAAAFAAAYPRSVLLDQIRKTTAAR